jgi:hypothetical protein
MLEARRTFEKWILSSSPAMPSAGKKKKQCHRRVEEDRVYCAGRGRKDVTWHDVDRVIIWHAWCGVAFIHGFAHRTAAAHRWSQSHHISTHHQSWCAMSPYCDHETATVKIHHISHVCNTRMTYTKTTPLSNDRTRCSQRKLVSTNTSLVFTELLECFTAGAHRRWDAHTSWELSRHGKRDRDDACTEHAAAPTRRCRSIYPSTARAHSGDESVTSAGYSAPANSQREREVEARKFYRGEEVNLLQEWALLRVVQSLNLAAEGHVDWATIPSMASGTPILLTVTDL